MSNRRQHLGVSPFFTDKRKFHQNLPAESDFIKSPVIPQFNKSTILQHHHLLPSAETRSGKNILAKNIIPKGQFI
jgi:hypothetical protein